MNPMENKIQKMSDDELAGVNGGLRYFSTSDTEAESAFEALKEERRRILRGQTPYEDQSSRPMRILS